MRFEVAGKAYSAARVWINEVPANAAHPTNAGTYFRLTCNGEAAVTNPFCCVELFIPMGGMAAYGRLGAWFVPDSQGGDLAVSIESGQEGAVYTGDALASKTDAIRLGLDDEMTAALAEHVSRAASPFHGLPPGALSFGWAAQGDVGTSVSTISLLADAIYWLLVHPGPPPSADQFRDAFDRRFAA
ncbi:MAG: hypothetical protein HKM95_01490 [Inquilinus sp.]|nr:hypothetical protein [Inquilinus sp.]